MVVVPVGRRRRVVARVSVPGPGTVRVAFADRAATAVDAAVPSLGVGSRAGAGPGGRLDLAGLRRWDVGVVPGPAASRGHDGTGVVVRENRVLYMLVVHRCVTFQYRQHDEQTCSDHCEG